RCPTTSSCALCPYTTLFRSLIGIPFGGKSPFRAEVYFVSMREFTDMKWGTAQPVIFRDTDLGMVRLRAFGTYSMRVKDPQVLVKDRKSTRLNSSHVSISYAV